MFRWASPRSSATPFASMTSDASMILPTLEAYNGWHGLEGATAEFLRPSLARQTEVDLGDVDHPVALRGGGMGCPESRRSSR